MKITERIKEKAADFGGSAPVVFSFIGDSVTHGCFEIYRASETELETEFRSTKAYHFKLRQMLETIFPPVCINVINAGISGDCAITAQNRIERDVISYHPDLCIMCFGLNDANRGIEAIDDYANALAAMFDKLETAGIETIFMTPNMMGTRVVAEEKDELLRSVIGSATQKQTDGTFDKFIERARAVCREHNVPVCDCYAKWKKLEENGADVTRLLANRVNHPLEEMHNLFAYSLFEMIMGF